MKIICYYTNSVTYGGKSVTNRLWRANQNKYCTHFVFGLGRLNNQTLQLEIDPNLLERFKGKILSNLRSRINSNGFMIFKWDIDVPMYIYETYTLCHFTVQVS